MNKNLLIILFPLILSLYSSRVNYESEKVESPHSAFSMLIVQNDSIIYNKYLQAKSLLEDDKYYDSLEKALFVLDNSSNIELNLYTNQLIFDIYRNINDHRKAIKYSKNVLNILDDKLMIDGESISQINLRSETLLKIASAFLAIPQVDSAKIYYEKVLNIKSLDRKVKEHHGKVYTNLSGVYFYFDEHRNFQKAEEYAEKAINIHKELNDNQSLAADYGNLASIYMEKGDPIKAKELYFKALDFIKYDNRLKAVKYKEVLYDNLGWAMYNLKDYIAYDYLDKSINIRDSLQEVSNVNIIKELEIKHNKDIAVREVQNQKKLAQQNTWIVGGIGISAALLLLYFLNVYKLRQQKLENEMSKSELIQQKKIEKLKTESQTKILNATIDGKEAERKQIAETLHDNISAMLSSANLHLQATQKQFNGSVPIELEKTQEIITQASQQIRDLSHNLVSSILLKFGLHYALKDAAEKYSNSEITFHTQLDNLKRYDQDFEIKVYNIVQEFINNILKHSKADRALIRLREKDNQLFLSIEDNGIGFNAEESIANGGIGLNQIMARVKMMNGTFKIDSEEDQGTTIKIVLPVKEKEKVSIV